MTKTTKLSTHEYLRAVASVAALSFKIAPLAVRFKITDALIDAALPIAVTYFAALLQHSWPQPTAGNLKRAT